MRTLLAALPFLLASSFAVAQTLPANPPVAPTTNGAPTTGGLTTVAPTPSIVPERVAPADRAGNDAANPAGPTASTPFSGAPQGGTGGQISPSLRGTEPSGSPSVPSLGR